LLDGGLTGGGGSSSPVSLQWMLFNQARVIGLPHPGGTVGPSGLHPNPNNRNETSLRHSITELQAELNALALRVGDRLVASGEISQTQRDNIFSVVPHDFTLLTPHMVSAEQQQMRNIQNRLDNHLRTALRTAEETFQITQDQINALGGVGAINKDGSRVLIESATNEWLNDARTTLENIRNALIGNGSLSAPHGYLGELANISDIESLNNFILNLVGYPNNAITTSSFSGVSSFGASSIMPLSTPPVPTVLGININTLVNGDSGTGWSFNAGVLTITGNEVFQINGTGVATTNRIVVQNGTNAEIILNNVNIMSTGFNAALDIRNNTVDMWLMGNNRMESIMQAGVRTTDGTLNINGTGTLTAVGGDGAGIGGGFFEAGGNININGGTIIAIGCVDGAGIGGGFMGDGGNITITGGTVTSRSDMASFDMSHGAGIGGGNFGNSGNITITGGTITVHANQGAGIGGGDFGNGENILISGGNVITNVVTSAGFTNSGAGIGGGMAGNGGTVTITGGIVIVSNEGDGAAIGGGSSSFSMPGNGADITISGGVLEVQQGWIGGGQGSTNNGTITVAGGNLSVSNPITDMPGGVRDSVGTSAFRIIATGVTLPAHLTVQYTIAGVLYEAMTDSNGELFLYLPAGSIGSEMIITHPVNGRTYTGFLTEETTHTDHTSIVTLSAPPVLTPGSVNRTSDEDATIYFNSDKPGNYFYIVQDDTDPPPIIGDVRSSLLSGSGIAGQNTITFDGLTPGAKRVFVVKEDEDGRISNMIEMTIPPYDPNQPPDLMNEGLIYDIERLLQLAMGALGTVNLESNAMWFQLGANAMQGMILQLKGIHTGILGGGRGDLAMLIDVREKSGIPISEQLDIIDIAEGIVNAQRAQLGAVQNRLEFTRQSVDISSENLTAAESRIRDTDMAKEMMRFTAAQVLQQAGISMLAQANQLPASILQLLQ
jgi:flagellin-like hook-associated protein FlgL